MSYHRSAAKSIALISSLVTAVTVEGCHPQPTPPDERPAEIDLPKAGESINLDRFRTQLAGFYRGPLHRHTRRAVCAAPRPGAPGCVAEVTIQAIGKSMDIHAKPGPMPGRIVGHIRNTDPEHTTEMYSLRPSSQAEYYLYIDRGPSGARWNLLEVPTRPFGPIGRVVLDSVTECNDGPGHEPLPEYSDVDFSKCGEHYPSPYKRAGILGNQVLPAFFSSIASRLRAPLPAASTIEAGSWYKCPTGCCT
jgi:hypothetical protein